MFHVHGDMPEPRILLTVDGVQVKAWEGELVASVLLRTKPYRARTTPVGEVARAPYCLMGVCFDCLAIVDGQPSVQTCIVAVRDGMVIERQHGLRKIAS